jgi:hypothetical protein
MRRSLSLMVAVLVVLGFGVSALRMRTASSQTLPDHNGDLTNCTTDAGGI